MSPVSVCKTMFTVPVEPTDGSVIVTQLAPESTTVAATPPTRTLVTVPKFPLVIVMVLPPAYGPAFVESWKTEAERPKL